MIGREHAVVPGRGRPRGDLERPRGVGGEHRQRERRASRRSGLEREERRADGAGVVAELCRHDRHAGRTSRRLDGRRRRRSRAGSSSRSPAATDPSPHHDDLGIEHVHEPRDPLAEPPAHLREDRARAGSSPSLAPPRVTSSPVDATRHRRRRAARCAESGYSVGGIAARRVRSPARSRPAPSSRGCRIRTAGRPAPR